jgi:hypothetical protein
MKNFVFLIVGLLVGIGLLALIVLVISHHLANSHALPPSNNLQTTNLKPITTPQSTDIDICSKQYSNYPTIANILTTKNDPNLGVYTGTISKVDSKQDSLTVTAQKSNTSFVFNKAAVEGKIYDTHTAQVNNIALVPTGSKVFISFPCKQEVNSFVINKIQMVQ